MYGAIIGDIVGSKYEFHNIKTKDFPLFSKGCDYTDDTIMTVAVARALIKSLEEQAGTNGTGKTLHEFMIEEMQSLGRKYPYPTGAYGGNFARWLKSKYPQPYGSYGNGSAMRASACGLIAVTLEEAEKLACISAEVTHNHPDGIKGAQAAAGAVFLARCCKTKEEIHDYITKYYYPLDFTIDKIRPSFVFDVSCRGTVPPAIEAFLESTGFEDAIRNIISIGGDCDTTGAVTGAVAWAYYSNERHRLHPDKITPDLLAIKDEAICYLPEEFIETCEQLREISAERVGKYHCSGGCTRIMTRAEWENAAKGSDMTAEV